MKEFGPRLDVCPWCSLRSATADLPDADPVRCRPPPPRQIPKMQTPPDGDPPGYVTCDACWEATLLVNRMTHRCKNITLPQTSFAGG